jgi:ABC-2 type transport system permease protein
MLHLLRIDLKKLLHYRTFWIVCGLYFVTLTVVTASGMEFLKWLARTVGGFGGHININRIPLYHFPDVWLNLYYISGLFKIVIGILVVISVTNEFQYRTVRQNIIDGMSRTEFLMSKVLTNVVLASASALLITLIGLVTGFIYSPSSALEFMLTDVEFVIAYFLEVFGYLSLALMLGVLVQRAGLTIVLLMTLPLLELIVREHLDDYLPMAIPFLPLESLRNLVPMPFERYAFQEIRDYLTAASLAIAAAWTAVFNGVSYLKLKRSDL